MGAESGVAEGGGEAGMQEGGSPDRRRGGAETSRQDRLTGGADCPCARPKWSRKALDGYSPWDELLRVNGAGSTLLEREVSRHARPFRPRGVAAPSPADRVKRRMRAFT